jgi:hypothetical protein
MASMSDTIEIKFDNKATADLKRLESLLKQVAELLQKEKSKRNRTTKKRNR